MVFHHKLEYRNADTRINSGYMMRKFGELGSSNSGVYKAQLCTAGIDHHLG